MQDGIENREYRLPQSHIYLKDNCLVRTDASGTVLASINLQDIERISCRRSIGWICLFFTLLVSGLAYLSFTSTKLGMFGYFIGSVLVLVALIALIGGLLETELSVKSRLGKLRFPVQDQASDADAFVMTARKLKEQITTNT